ncbi:MAG TPA: energy transducer TonB [Terriglobales bacterium]|jgi:TonB family protein|nr:energy transducer TonB [Terriglobales bacterium]
MRRTLLATLLLTSLLSASDKTHEGQEILEQARSRSDIRELPSFTMRATVKIENKDKLLEGEYALLWNGPDQWREEISFPGFDQIRIGGPGTVALKRNLDFVPLRVFQLERALGYGREGLTLRPDEGIEQVRTRKVSGIEARCAEITGKLNTREICVDASTGAVVRDRRFMDKEFAPIGAQIFPHVLSYIEEGKTVARAEVTELKTTERLPSSSFEVPAGAVSKPNCLNPTVGLLIKKVNPSYPESDKRGHVQGTVAIYAVIGVDGSLHDLRIVSGVSPGLDKASLDAVQQWRYEPYKCQDTPVEVESVIQVNYSLHY